MALNTHLGEALQKKPKMASGEHQLIRKKGIKIQQENPNTGQTKVE